MGASTLVSHPDAGVDPDAGLDPTGADPDAGVDPTGADPEANSDPDASATTPHASQLSAISARALGGHASAVEAGVEQQHGKAERLQLLGEKDAADVACGAAHVMALCPGGRVGG